MPAREENPSFIQSNLHRWWFTSSYGSQWQKEELRQIWVKCCWCLTGLCPCYLHSVCCTKSNLTLLLSTQTDFGRVLSPVHIDSPPHKFIKTSHLLVIYESCHVALIIIIVQAHGINIFSCARIRTRLNLCFSAAVAFEHWGFSLWFDWLHCEKWMATLASWIIIFSSSHTHQCS